MPAQKPQKPARPAKNTVAYTVFIGDQEHVVLKNKRVIRIDPNTEDQEEITPTELENRLNAARAQVTKLRQPAAPREKSQDIVARERKDRAR